MEFRRFFVVFVSGDRSFSKAGDLAFSNSALRCGVRPRPPRFMKYVSIRMPDPGPLGETLLEANALAMVLALLVNRPCGGCVESVGTLAIHRFFLFLPAMFP